jgi:hypothetical protein
MPRAEISARRTRSLEGVLNDNPLSILRLAGPFTRPAFARRRRIKGVTLTVALRSPAPLRPSHYVHVVSFGACTSPSRTAVLRDILSQSLSLTGFSRVPQHLRGDRDKRRRARNG